MTSLDDHRTLRTREEIVALAGRVQQVTVLSHSKPFLCSLWEQADRNASIALRINRAAIGSEIALWDVRNDSISEYDKRHELIRAYLQVADPAKEREVAQALRPILEAFMRVAYPANRSYAQILELPTFGHSDNHAGLQVCDLICSAPLYPIACYAYRTGHVANVHVQPGAVALVQRYGQTIRGLQYRYLDAATGRYRGGLVVSDAIQQRNATLMFR